MMPLYPKYASQRRQVRILSILHAWVPYSSTLSYSLDQLISGSWDCTLRFWDPRAETSTSAPVETLNLPERVYCMDITNNFLVVGMASRLFHIYDLRQTKKLWQERESSLKFLTRSVACMSDGKGTYKIIRVSQETMLPSKKKLG